MNDRCTRKICDVKGCQYPPDCQAPGKRKPTDRLKCPKCGHRKSKITNTWSAKNDTEKRRCHACLKCGHRYTTREVIAEHQLPGRGAVKTISNPTSGVYWWRRDDTEEWRLSEVTHDCDLFTARFFNGMRIRGKPWGQWVRIDIQKPA